MLTGKSHLNKQLVSITDGKIIGEVKDLYLDREMHNVAALLLGKEGLALLWKDAVEELRTPAVRTALSA